MQWVCDICGYVHDEEEPPDNCPVCGAPKSKFSEWTEDDDLTGEDYIEDDDADLDYGDDDDRDKY
jgi:hypothetical protein